MAVIARNITRRFALRGLLLSAFVSAPVFAQQGDRASDALAQIGYVATALTAGNAADAMTPFDKSYPEFSTLEGYFNGLAHAFQLGNEVDVIDQQDSTQETRLVVNWTLTLTDLATNYEDRRTGEMNITLKNKGGKWRIVDFRPISIFNPLQGTRQGSRSGE
jgi:hypothetical protein